MRKKILAVIMCSFMAIAFAACGSTETSSTESSEETETTTETTTETSTEAVVNEDSDFTTEDDYETVDYDKLARNPDDYEGNKIKISGEVLQVIEGEGETELRIATDDDWDDVVLVYYESDIVDSRVLEEDNVTAYGVSKGLYTYESTGGGNITIPYMHVQKISIDD